VRPSEFAVMWARLPAHEVIRIHPWLDEVRLWLIEPDAGLTLTGAAARYYKEWWVLQRARPTRQV
jgi:hypothetical protein